MDLAIRARTEIKSALSVSAVIEWALKNVMPFEHELIQQDEYSIDLIIRVTSDLFLVYDSN